MAFENNSIVKESDVGNTNKNNESESDSRSNASNIVIGSNNDDDDDDDNERMVVFKAMKLLEVSTYKRPHYKELPEIFRGLWRKQIIEWMYVLIKHCKLKHEATAAAIYYLDIAVSLSKSNSHSSSSSSLALVQTPEDYQLCAMTALHLALKVYDSPTVRIVKLNCLVKLGNGEFTENDIIQKEQDLLQALHWRLHPPTPDCFLYRYLELLPILDHYENESDNKNKSKYEHNNDRESTIERQERGDQSRRQQRLSQLEETASGIIEIALACDRFLAVPPSVIAYAALLQAMELTADTNTTDYIDVHTYTHRPQQQEQQRNRNYDWSVFLRNMKDVAGMGDIVNDSDHENYNLINGDDNDDNNGSDVSCLVLETKMLLDRIVIQGLPLEDEVDDEGKGNIEIFNATSTTKTIDSCCGGDKLNHNSFSSDRRTSKLSSTPPPSPTSTISSNTTATTKATLSSSSSTVRSSAIAAPSLQV